MFRNYALIALTATAALLSACETLPRSEDDPNNPTYEAHGTEPFWSLLLADGTMTFSHPGDQDLFAKRYDARPSFNGMRYISKAITADVTYTECSDGMSDFTYKDTVTVKLGGFDYTGCGGSILPPKAMDDTHWMVLSVGGEGLNSDRQAMFAFANGRMSGNLGCNKLGAEYKFDNRKLSFGSIMSTKMGCPEPIGRQESMFLKILGGSFTTEFTPDGSMVLTAADEQRVVFKRSG